MPEYLSPGVYVEEYEIGPKPIEGVSTSTGGFLGVTARGPVSPKFITSFDEYSRIYGGFINESFLPYAVDGFFRNGGKRCFVGRIAAAKASESSASFPAKAGGGKEGEAKGEALMVTAVGPGTWGNRIGVKIEAGSLASKNPTLFKMTVFYWDEVPPTPIVDPMDPDKQKDEKRREPLVTEVYDNLSPNPKSSDNYEKRVNGVSALVELAGLTSQAPAAKEITLLDGDKKDDPVKLTDYEGVSSTEGSTGLAAFKEIDEIAIVCVPNENDIDKNALTMSVVNHCESMKDRFAIIQAPDSVTDIAKFEPPTDSKFAAIYYPWIKVMDPLTQRLKLIPPGGHVAGIYARTDTERGVHKAPANEVVRGASALQFPVMKGMQDMLNPRGINCIRAFAGRGIRVWGARTISSDPIWKYINVRRLFNYLEESIEEGTQWVVFEPNDVKLWARVKQTISLFLTTQWRNGALMGNTPEEAFFVKCDRTTMTQDDIDNGRLIVKIGVAPVKPAEFVIFRIAQWAGGSAATE
jgi:phage tail sheath protein FI